MNRSHFELLSDLEGLIDSLDLSHMKSEIIDDTGFTYILESYSNEDYSTLGNSRLGGLPDLPYNIEYPYNDEGYYNLLCQINFGEFKDKLNALPEAGILYIFDGNSTENDSVTIFSPTTNDLVRKTPPKNLRNLNYENRDSHYDGLKAEFQLDTYFGAKTYDLLSDLPEANNAILGPKSRYQTHILGAEIDPCYAYLYLKGFDTLLNDVLLYKGIRHDYESQLNAYVKECTDAIARNDTREAYYRTKLAQLTKLDNEKEVHFNSYEEVTCLVGLESLDKLKWIWGDSGFKYVYILNEDLRSCNFSNLLVETWSS